MLIQNAEIEGRRADLRIEGDTIAALAPRLEPWQGETVIEAQGHALIPGLHDHHIHLTGLAAAMQSLRCGPPEVADEQQLIAALHAAPGAGWLRGIGYHDSVAGPIDRAWLDRHGPARPVRIQHRGGRLWIVNSLALEHLGDWAPQDGRLLDMDEPLRAALGACPPDLAPALAALAARGVTGLTDATPSNGPEDFARLAAACGKAALTVMGRLSLAEAAQTGRAGVGPVKLHYHDHDLPPLDELTRLVAAAHDQGRPVASHCVTHAELALTLAAIEAAGPMTGDRIEHAALASPDMIDWLRRLGLTVVTQPHFIAERAFAYRKEVPPHDLPDLWRLGSWARAGTPLAAGSDAPFGGWDPWAAMAAAVRRPEGLGEDEAVSPEHALELYLKPAEDAAASPRRVKQGALADLCLLDRPWREARGDLGAVSPVKTWAAGELVHDAQPARKPTGSD